MELHDYQKYAVQFIEEHPIAALFLDMGLGKTITTLTAIHNLMFDLFAVRKVLIIAPLRVARDTWAAEIEKWEHLKDLRYSVAVGTEEERLAAERAEQERKATEERRKAEEERRAAEKAEADRLAKEQAARKAEQPQEITATPLESPSSAPYHFALRANLLRWATLTPDLGLEWRVHPSWGILVNGSWTSWSWNGKDRRYALWEVMPEVRYYTGKEKRGYLGVMFKAGQFNYKLSGTGRQGDLMGGGITGGYQLRLSDALSLDFNVAVGCLHADYEKYEVIDGVRVRAGKETKNWWGPVNAGVTLVWKLF